jgi:hypothetical protein
MPGKKPAKKKVAWNSKPKMVIVGAKKKPVYKRRDVKKV